MLRVSQSLSCVVVSMVTAEAAAVGDLTGDVGVIVDSPIT